MDASIDDLIAEFIGFAISKAALDAAAGHPGTETVGLVLATVLLNWGGAAQILAPRCATEFTRPDDQRVFEEAARLQVLDKSRAGLVGLGGGLRQVAADVPVVIPAAKSDLHKAHAGFAHAPG